MKPEYAENQCPNCGEENFLGITTAYDRCRFDAGSFDISGTDLADYRERLVCSVCGEEIDEDKSVEQGRIVLKEEN